MREFIFISNRGWTTSEFNLNNLPGAGRMDVVCRVMNSAIWLSHNLRKDIRLYIILKGKPNPPLTLIFESGKLKGLRPDERSTAGFIKKVIENYENSGKRKFSRVKIINSGLNTILKYKRNILWLDENGTDILNIEMPENPIFVIGDHKGILKEDKKILKRKKAIKVSIGPLPYMASHCVSFINIYLDRLELYRKLQMESSQE